MINWTALIAVGLSTAGLACGATRPRWPKVRRIPTLASWLVGVVVLVPVGLIGLAKLFDSNVLGWMFGLTLMLGVALIPCGALFGIGYWIGSRLARRARARPRRVPDGPAFTIRIDRDSVCAGDDTEPHDRVVVADPTTRLSAFIDGLQRARYLPSIQGGEATWTIESSASSALPIGVCAQQWSHARLHVGDEPLSRHFAGRPPSVFFRYHGQVGPDATLAGLVGIGGRVPA